MPNSLAPWARPSLRRMPWPSAQGWRKGGQRGVLEQFKSVVEDRYRVIAEHRQPGQPVIGWMCSYVPEEIIYAAGMYPTRVMGGSGDTPVADAYLFTNLCSFVRACLEDAFRGNCDFLYCFVPVNSRPHIRRLGDVWT